jgi:hypothetical protein
VKNRFLLFIILFCVTSCFAQDTVKQKNRLTDSVIERFYVLRSDKTIKEGLYKAFFKRKTLIASGNYSKNLKTGIWQFSDRRGRLVEKYDYDKNRFTYIAPLWAPEYLSLLFDDTLKEGDRITRPLKIGGIYYGYIPYVNLFQLPFDTFGVSTYAFHAYVELLISPLGRLADYNVRIVSSYYDYDHTFNLDVKLFNEADRTFIPATLNGKRVMSRIVIKCFVTPSGGLDFY